MNWQRIFTLFVILALLSTTVSAADDGARIGFWARVKAMFGSEPAPVDIRPQIEIAQPPTCTATVQLCKDGSGYVKCEGSYEECIAKFTGACECGVPDETTQSDEKLPELPPPIIEQEELLSQDDATTQTRSCNRCSAVVCDTASGKEFLCPSNLEKCQEKYGKSCRALGCYPQICTAKLHTCWTSVTDRKTTCEGSYEECARKYEKCDCGTTPELCIYNNQKYEQGETFPATDGCNTCTCMENGNVGCTKRACPVDECTKDADCPVINCLVYPCPVNRCIAGTCTPVDEGKYCVYADEKHAAGESFPDSDGCNTCTCLDNGRVVCTERACPVIDECSTVKDCPEITCIRAPCDAYVCKAGTCVLTSGELEVKGVVA